MFKEAAEFLGVPPSTLSSKLKRLGIEKHYMGGRNRRRLKFILHTFAIVMRCLAPALLCLLLFVFGCRQTPAKAPDRAFYYWRSVFSLSPEERQSLRSLHINQLYIKYFDVAWDAASRTARPIAVLRVNDPIFKRLTVVPVVFITNETLLNIDTAAIAGLAANMAGLITQLQQGQGSPAKEIQLDCDWTAATRDRYFALIKQVRQWLDSHRQQQCILSATIRLYQCKYKEKAGIPPVSKGLLMCYNMGNLKDPAARNSILDPEELEKYASSLSSYPLPLDVALPLFDWKVLFREGRYKGIIQDLSVKTLQNNSAVQKEKENSYTFIKDTSLENYAFQAGDRLRAEACEYDAISEAARIVARHLQTNPSNIILYHLAPANLSKYSTHELENIFDRFD